MAPDQTVPEPSHQGSQRRIQRFPSRGIQAQLTFFFFNTVLNLFYRGAQLLIPQGKMNVLEGSNGGLMLSPMETYSTCDFFQGGGPLFIVFASMIKSSPTLKADDIFKTKKWRGKV